MRIVTCAEMRRLEAIADSRGLTYGEMMRRAGEAVSRAVESELGEASTIVVLAGPGNNGGDALVSAIELNEAGHDVRVALWRREMDGDELVGQLVRGDVPILRTADDPRLENLQDWLEDAEVVVDGLLGSGADARPIQGELAAVLDLVLEARRRPDPILIVAIDIPTGVHPDTGGADPRTLSADITVSLGYPKIGLYGFPAASFVGDLMNDSLGIPDDGPAEGPFVMAPEEVAAQLPHRPMDGHKGSFGKVIIVAGSANFTGAAYLAATAAYRVGAGIVVLAVPGSLHPILATLIPEAVFLRLPEEDGVIAPEAAPAVRAAFDASTVAILGPGLTTTPAAAAFMNAFLGPGAPLLMSPPVVVDADALSLLAAADALGRLPPGSVLTPHPGELSRMGYPPAPGVSQRIDAARDAARRFGQVTLLKGAFTIVADPNGATRLNPFAGSALATAGTGDVLAGVIAGLMAQGMGAFAAAAAAAFIHGAAGLRAARELGERSVIAGDVIDLLPSTLMDLV